ncbi:DUF167 domain-containing protein [Alteriqipengyuania lutimaris]|uniref:UPF0235 protein DL238_03105 n=1 Tax=Alteriqipengyuania lutimaris TaxID=1538146 RepID=A0A395LIZ0_9SPHN|nr:DUF167 domain-containing protein [Alteriqipengyuania lutimaris]MBB3034411.1 hypothetical protein [Alteriqipengyuania lutimaris]RDS76691.1 DUF167 domain-containing protein [Alteriqipengyuania lutimaris]
MTRPAADLPDATALRALISGEELRVRVTPGARTESVSIIDSAVQVKVRAKPQDGAANTAVEVLVAKALGIPKSRCAVLRGATSREKVLAVTL